MFVKQRTTSLSIILGSKFLQLKYITDKDLLVTGWWSGGNWRSYWVWIWVGGWPSTNSPKKWSLWELRSCDCGVLLDVRKPLGSLTSTWGPGGGSVGMKQGYNFQEVCMFTASHCMWLQTCEECLVTWPWSTNHHQIRLESGESVLILGLTLRLDSTW